MGECSSRIDLFYSQNAPKLLPLSACCCGTDNWASLFFNTMHPSVAEQREFCFQAFLDWFYKILPTALMLAYVLWYCFGLIGWNVTPKWSQRIHVVIELYFCQWKVFQTLYCKWIVWTNCFCIMICIKCSTMACYVRQKIFLVPISFFWLVLILRYFLTIIPMHAFSSHL